MKDIKKDIEAGAIELKNIMQANLANIAEDMIDQVIKKSKKLKGMDKFNAIKDIKPKGIDVYKNEILTVMAVIASDSLDQVRKEIPKASKVKFIENEERLMFGEFENLPKDIRQRITQSNDLLVGTQIADLEKSIFLQFDSSTSSGKDIAVIKKDMEEKAEKYILGSSVRVASTISSSQIVNESRNGFFFEDEVLDEIEAFQFMNSDPVTLICKDLVGTVFSKNEANHFLYTPPLHYNCKSWIRAIIKLDKNQKITRLKPSSKKIADTIQFSDTI